MATLVCLVNLAMLFASASMGRHSAERYQVSPISPIDWIKQPDARLERLATIRCSRAPIGEVLEAIQGATGVALGTSQSDVLSGFEITIFVRDCPLKNVLEGIRSLFSHHRAQWFWTQIAAGETAPSYVLFRSPAARQLSNLVRADIERLFDRTLEEQITWLDSSPEERSRLEANNLLLSIVAGEENRRARAGLALVARHVPRERRIQMSRSGEITTIPLEKLNPDEKAWVDELLTSSIPNPQQRLAISPPDKVSVRVSRNGDLTPSLFIDIPMIGGYAYVGGVPMWKRMAAEIAAGWRSPAEEVRGGIGDRVISGHPTPAQVELQKPVTRDSLRRPEQRIKPSRLQDSLDLVASGADVDIIAEASLEELARRLPLPYDKTLRQFCEELEDVITGCNFMAKVRSDVILVRDRNFCWNSPEDGLVSWKQLKKWRERLTANNGAMTLRILEDLFALKEPQTARVAADFPEVTHIRSKGSVLMLWSRLPQLSRRMAEKRGLALAGVPRQLLQPLVESGLVSYEDLRAGTLKVSERQIITTAPDGTPLAGALIQGVITRPNAPEIHTALLARARTKQQLESRVEIRLSAPR